MRFRLIITLCLLLCLSNLLAQDSVSDVNRTKIDYYFLHTQYMDVFSETPSILTGWKYDSWSYIGADYDLAKGNFRNPQKYNSLSQINIKTESVYRPDNGNWMFHGKFRYSNGEADSVYSNLSYHVDRSGSPYYFFQKKEGNWNLQNYEFNVTAANQVTDRLSLGFKILYNGDLTFRTTDTRNNQTSLITNLVASAGYKLSENNTLSIGVKLNRVKTEPNLSNKYHQSGVDLTYNRYLNTGLGSYIKNVDFKATMEDKSYGAVVQLLNQSENSSYSAIYEIATGEEWYVNKKLTDINEQNRILNYDYMSHKVRASSLHSLSNAFISACFNLELLKGDGKQWSDQSLSYIENYEVDILDVDIRATLYRPFSFIRRINVSAKLHDESRFDKSYGYQFNYTNLLAGINTEAMFRIKSFRTGFMVGVSYGKNLDNLNFPNAASSNIYVNWIANPLMSYLTCDFLEIPAYLRFDIPFKTNLVEVLMTANHQYPIKMATTADALFNTDDNFRSYNISLKFYF